MVIKVLRTSDNRIEAIDLEEYLRGVVPGEMDHNAPPEALKAQAICARTYAYRAMLNKRARGYDHDVDDTTSNQVYKPWRIMPGSDAAVSATKGIVMLYDGDPIGAWFSNSNGGRIKSSFEKWGGKEFPYSKSKNDPWDTYGGGGHGVGMSQEGAKAMALAGKNYQEILNWYFEGAFELVNLYETAKPKALIEEFKMETPKEPVKTPVPVKQRLKIPSNISEKAADAIRADLEKYADKLSVLMCLDALKYAYDQTTTREYPIAHYFRGVDLYNPDFTLATMSTEDALNKEARDKPEWYPKRTLEMMQKSLAWCSERGDPLTGCDCSGLITGLSRKYGIIQADSDAIADGWCGTSRARQIDRKQLEPGDYLHRPGHVGLYVGGGYAVEAVGGDFGVQLTVVTDRKATSFLDYTPDGSRKVYKPYRWEDYWRPRYKYDVTYFRRRTPYSELPLPMEDTPEGKREKAFIAWIKGVLRLKNTEAK